MIVKIEDFDRFSTETTDSVDLLFMSAFVSKFTFLFQLTCRGTTGLYISMVWPR